MVKEWRRRPIRDCPIANTGLAPSHQAAVPLPVGIEAAQHLNLWVEQLCTEFLHNRRDGVVAAPPGRCEPVRRRTVRMNPCAHEAASAVPIAFILNVTVSARHAVRASIPISRYGFGAGSPIRENREMNVHGRIPPNTAKSLASLHSPPKVAAMRRNQRPATTLTVSVTIAMARLTRGGGSRRRPSASCSNAQPWRSARRSTTSSTPARTKLPKLAGGPWNPYRR
jgi:hypothetical protein